MLGPIFNHLGNLLGEEVPVSKEPQVEQDPLEFQPGFLFDASASWVLFFRKLFIPKSDKVEDTIKVQCDVICDNPECETCHKPAKAVTKPKKLKKVIKKKERCKKGA